MRRRPIDALDAAGGVAVEDRGVLGVGDPAGRVDERLELRIFGSALDGVDLLTRELEIRAQLDEGHGLPARGLDALGRRAAERLAASGVDGAGRRPQRSFEVDELPPGELQLQDAGGLGVDLFPRGARDWRKLSLQIVHSPWPPFRLPMPSEPLPSALDWAAPSAAMAFSRAINEPLVNRYSLRCASIVASRRRYHSRSIAKCSFSSSRLCARIAFRSPSVAASTRWSYQSAASSSSCMDVSARWLSSVSGLSLSSDSWYPAEFAIAAPSGTGVPMHLREVGANSRYSWPGTASTTSPATPQRSRSVFDPMAKRIGIAAGFVVMAGLLRGTQLRGWTAVFLVTTVATSVTGYRFPVDRLLPSHVVGALSLVVLVIAIVALYGLHLRGVWRRVYVVCAALALYALAPQQNEPPFVIVQLIVLAGFVVLTILAVQRFRVASGDHSGANR